MFDPAECWSLVPGQKPLQWTFYDKSIMFSSWGSKRSWGLDDKGRTGKGCGEGYYYYRSSGEEGCRTSFGEGRGGEEINCFQMCLLWGEVEKGWRGEKGDCYHLRKELWSVQILDWCLLQPRYNSLWDLSGSPSSSSECTQPWYHRLSEPNLSGVWFSIISPPKDDVASVEEQVQGGEDGSAEVPNDIAQ